MDSKIYRHVHFIAGENDDFFDVEENVLYGFFSCRTIKSVTGEHFSISTIYGPYYDYKNNNLDLEDIVSVTFVYHKSDVNPFLLILEKSNNTNYYYGVLNSDHRTCRQIGKLKGTAEQMQQKSLLDVLKQAFSEFFEWDLRLYESTIKSKIYTHSDNENNIKPEVNIEGKYKRYYIKPRTPISVSNIYIIENKMDIEKSLKFVEHLYFYYSNDEYSTPLMMETVDYQIGGSLPYINYFIPESVGNKWVPVECGTDLLEPKCKSDIKRILDGVVEMYRNYPVTIDIKKPKYNWDIRPVVGFSNTSFLVECENADSYICHTYKSKPTRSFFIKNIMFDKEKQEIDIQSREFEFITVYYKVDQPERPLLICFKLHNKANNVDRFRWFYIPRFYKNVWLELDFEAHPHNDKMLIEQKIKSMYGSKPIINYIMAPLRWFTFYRVLSITIALMLLRNRRRLRLILFRLYHHIRR